MKGKERGETSTGGNHHFDAAREVPAQDPLDTELNNREAVMSCHPMSCHAVSTESVLSLESILDPWYTERDCIQTV